MQPLAIERGEVLRRLCVTRTAGTPLAEFGGGRQLGTVCQGQAHPLAERESFGAGLLTQTFEHIVRDVAHIQVGHFSMQAFYVAKRKHGGRQGSVSGSTACLTRLAVCCAVYG